MLNGLLDQVKTAIFEDPSTPHKDGFDPSGLISKIEGMFNDHPANQTEAGGSGGDPAVDATSGGSSLTAQSAGSETGG